MPLALVVEGTWPAGICSLLSARHAQGGLRDQFLAGPGRPQAFDPLLVWCAGCWGHAPCGRMDPGNGGLWRAGARGKRPGKHVGGYHAPMTGAMDPPVQPRLSRHAHACLLPGVGVLVSTSTSQVLLSQVLLCAPAHPLPCRFVFYERVDMGAIRPLEQTSAMYPGVQSLEAWLVKNKAKFASLFE